MFRSLCLLLLTSLFFSGCMGSGVTVNKGTTLPYLAKTLKKSKDWFRSTNNDSQGLDQPPPPSPHLPTSNTTNQPELQSANSSKSKRMGKQDYTNAIEHMKNSIPELSSAHGPESMEVAETHHTIGAMYAMQDERENARFHFSKALPIFSAWLGKEHPRVWKLKRQMQQLK